jgi:hypothetical protein
MKPTGSTKSKKKEFTPIAIGMLVFTGVVLAIQKYFFRN